MDLAGLQEAVFKVDEQHFDFLAMEIFKFQSENCPVYKRFLNYLQIDMSKIMHIDDIPYLPIGFFKDQEIKSGDFTAEIIFESSSTTGTGVSRHHVKDLNVYTESFTRSFNCFFDDYQSYCHLALLPSYLERQHSSLVFQVDYFIRHSVYEQSSFFLHNADELYAILMENEKQQIPTILWGVTYALLDFIDRFKLKLKHTIIIETGGMKGKRKEITRMELHELLRNGLSVKDIGGEYGMTELMSQAYAVRAGLYQCPPWMRVSGREINDPLGRPVFERHAAINIIDLANLHSCSFIATSDLGKVYRDKSFEILGRIDYSDTRGCNLLID